MLQPSRTLPLAALALVIVTPALALDLPPRKPGLWEVKMTSSTGDALPTVMQQCIDAETDKLMNSFGSAMSAEMCPKQEFKTVGNTIIADTVCNLGGATSTSHAELTGDFQSSYGGTITTDTQGGIPAMNGKSTMRLDAWWTGACKADQRPGDMITPNGMKVNIRDMQGMKRAAPAKQAPQR